MHSNSQYSRPVAWERCASNERDNLSKKNGFWAKKPQRNVFLGVFTHYCTISLRNYTAVLRWYSNLQDSRPFHFKSGKTKIEPQNSSQFLFTTSEISRVSRSWFSLRENLPHFSLSYFYCIASIALKFTVESPSCLRKVRRYEKGQLYQKRMGSGPKNHKEMFFLGFSHITALYRSAILLQCSVDTQTYRIVARFNLKGGKTKIEPQNSSQFLFTTSEISRVSRSWFSLRETLAHFSLSYFYCIASIALKLTL